MIGYGRIKDQENNNTLNTQSIDNTHIHYFLQIEHVNNKLILIAWVIMVVILQDCTFNLTKRMPMERTRLTIAILSIGH